MKVVLPVILGLSLVSAQTITGRVYIGNSTLLLANTTPPLTVLPNGTTTGPYSAPISATGGLPPYQYSLVGGGLPAGLTLSTTTGLITGNPSTSQTSVFQVQAKDRLNAIVSQSYQLTINQPQDCTILTTNLPGAIVGAAYSAPLATSFCTSPTFSISVGGAGFTAAGLSINSATGTITASNPASPQTVNFTVMAHPSAGVDDTQPLSIVITSSAGCGPPAYNCSRSDLIPAPNPAVPPKVGPNTCSAGSLTACGNLTGANTVVTDPDFNNRIVRLTDSTTSSNDTIISDPSGSDDTNIWKSDSTFLVVADGVSTQRILFAFNKTTMQGTKCGTLPSGGYAWADALSSNPNALYAAGFDASLTPNNTAVVKYDFTGYSCGAAMPTPTLVVDFDNSQCLQLDSNWVRPAANAQINRSQLAVSQDGTDVIYEGLGDCTGSGTPVAACNSTSPTTGQGSGFFEMVYKPGSGCRFVDSASRQVYGQWGTEDLMGWWMMDGKRQTQFTSGSPNPSYSYLDADGEKFWRIKASAGNPWDIKTYGTIGSANTWCPNDAGGNPQICFWITENSAAGTSNASGYKRQLAPFPISPRYFTQGSTVTTTTAGPNNAFRTANCELDSPALSSLGQVQGVVTGPTVVAWGGSVGTKPTILVTYYYGFSGGIYNERERFNLVKGFGVVQWDHSTWNGSAYNAPDNTTTHVTLSNGTTTPNFPCYSTVLAAGNWIGGAPGAGGNSTATLGAYLNPDAFTFHEVLGSKSPDWELLGYTKCLSGACSGTKIPYFWNIATLNVTQPTGGLSGHFTEGFSKWYNNSGSTHLGEEDIRSFNALTSHSSVITAFPNNMVIPFDNHYSWNNVDTLDTYPVVHASWSPTPSQAAALPTAWYNEVLGTFSSAIGGTAAGTVKRFAHSFILGNNTRFDTMNAIGSVSQDGRFFALSSDWLGTLGAESGAATCAFTAYPATPTAAPGNCRGDVFIVELDPAPATSVSAAIYPTTAITVEHLASEPFSAWVNSGSGPQAGTWSVTAGTGTITASGIFTAPNVDESDTVRFQCSGAVTCSVTKNITVAGTIPSYSCSWPSGGTGSAGDATCTMTHDTTTRTFYVHVPTNFVAGTSGLVLEFSGGDVDGLSFCNNAGLETYGPGRFVDSLASPAPMIICPHPLKVGTTLNWHSIDFDTDGCGRTWTPNVCPNDSDFVRQIILAAKKDKNINLKAVGTDGQWNNGATMAARVAIEQGDLISVVGMRQNQLRNPRGVNQSAGPTSVVATSYPVSVLELATTGSNASLLTVCGVNNATNNFQYNYDDMVDYFNQINAWTLDNPSSTFCGGKYSVSSTNYSYTSGTTFVNKWSGAGSLLEKKGTAGLLNTEGNFWVLKGGTNQVYCSPNTACATPVHFITGACSTASPCNTTMDSNTGDTENDLYFTFYKNHPKP